MAEVRLTVFQGMLEKKLFPDNAFYAFSKNAGQPNAQTIEIPQEEDGEEPILGGVNSGYYTTANNLAAATALSPVIRVNDKLSYSNTIIRPPHPFVFETLQEVELTYSKASDVAQQQAQNMNTAIANYFATRWAQDTASYVVGTTGVNKKGLIEVRDTTATTGAKGGYAGMVNRFAYQDLLNLLLLIKKQNLSGGTWRALPTPELWQDMLMITDIVDYEKTGNQTMLQSGVVGSWGGVLFMNPRQNDRWEANVLYDLTNPVAPVPVTYAGALNANCVSALMVWNDQYVERNEGGIKFFSRKDDPIYMGDIVQWGVRCGASKRRLDGRGVICIYEKPNEGGAVIA